MDKITNALFFLVQNSNAYRGQQTVYNDLLASSTIMTLLAAFLLAVVFYVFLGNLRPSFGNLWLWVTFTSIAAIFGFVFPLMNIIKNLYGNLAGFVSTDWSIVGWNTFLAILYFCLFSFVFKRKILSKYSFKTPF